MKRHLLPAFLVACTLCVALWLIVARRSGQPFKPFDLTASAFVGFEPTLAGGEVKSLPVTSRDAAEPNIALFMVERQGGFLTRLVHGYNMPMCMKIKGYRVEAVGDLRRQEPGDRPGRSPAVSGLGLPIQLWRVTSSIGEGSLWVTTMVRAGDFAPTSEDICSMAFPRVDIPDDPNWIPRGLTWNDLKHPLVSLRRWAGMRWNASRTDLLTFLRLRQPAWASEELLTYVTRTTAPELTPENEAELIRKTCAVHVELLETLRRWRTAASNPVNRAASDQP